MSPRFDENILWVTAKRLYSVDHAGHERLDELILSMVNAVGTTEEQKSADPIIWVSLMHTSMAQTEEVILGEYTNI